MRHANTAACQDQIGRQSARPDMGTVLRNPALPPLARQPAVLEIEEIKSVPYAPVSHPFIERLIGTIRREYLDRVFFWNAADLARKLREFADYYNAYRVHRSLDGTTPAQRAGASSPAPASLDR